MIVMHIQLISSVVCSSFLLFVIYLINGTILYYIALYYITFTCIPFCLLLCGITLTIYYSSFSWLFSLQFVFLFSQLFLFNLNYTLHFLSLTFNIHIYIYIYIYTYIQHRPFPSSDFQYSTMSFDQGLRLFFDRPRENMVGVNMVGVTIMLFACVLRVVYIYTYIYICIH